MPRAPYLALLPVLALSLTGCVNSSTFSRPNTSAEEYSYAGNRKDAALLQSTQWWETIDDSNLQDDVQTLLKNNLSIKAATQRIIQAREQTLITDASLLPSIDLNAAHSRSRLNTPAGRSYTTSYSTDLDASWQLDLFGKIESASKNAAALADASALDRHALIQTLIGDLVNQRIQIAAITAQISYTQDTVDTLHTLYDVTKSRYEKGVSNITALDVERALESWKSTKASLPTLRANRTAVIYAYNILKGLPPGTSYDLERDANFPLLTHPLDFKTPPPVALLDARPDIMAAEQRLRAAQFNVDNAIASLYPDLVFAGSGGFSSEELGNLLDAQSLVWSLVQSISQSLFEGGAKRAAIRQREARAEELAQEYGQSVLEALKDAETALENEKQAHETLNLRMQTIENRYKILDLTRSRFEEGLASLSDILDSQQLLLQSKQQLSQDFASLWQARVALHLALGGSWPKPDATGDLGITTEDTTKNVEKPAAGLI